MLFGAWNRDAAWCSKSCQWKWHRNRFHDITGSFIDKNELIQNIKKNLTSVMLKIAYIDIYIVTSIHRNNVQSCHQ